MIKQGRDLCWLVDLLGKKWGWEEESFRLCFENFALVGGGSSCGPCINRNR